MNCVKQRQAALFGLINLIILQIKQVISTQQGRNSGNKPMARSMALFVQLVLAAHCSNVTVQKLAFVFRNANGTVVGRAADGSDIYYDIYPANAGLIAQFMKPESTLLISPTDSLETVVAASRFCDLKVYDNGTLVFQDSSKQETFYLSDTVPGMHTVILEATDSSTTVYDTIQYAVEPPLQVATLPGGMEMGLNELNDTTVFFKLYAPGKSRVYVLTSVNDYLPEPENAMTRTPAY